MALSQEIIDKIPKLYNEYHNKSQVARELNISVSTVSKYLKVAGIFSENKNSDNKQKITPELIDKINQLYAECKNMAEVSRQLHISTTTIKKFLTQENLTKNDKNYEDREALWYYICKLFNCETVSPWNVTQMERFKKKGINYKAQLLTLKYFFEIKHSSIEKSKGSIGIIPYVYDESRAYWLKEKDKREKVEEAIKKQLEQDRFTIVYDPTQYYSTKKKKKEINLSDLEES